MLLKINDNTIINLDQIVEIVKDDSNLMIYIYLIDDNRERVKFEDENMLDNAFNKILTSYSYGNLICDITQYVKKGE